MDEQLKDVDSGKPADDHKPPIDLLRRVFVPVEKRTAKGTVFRTIDKTLYTRMKDGSIRRVHPKTNGKAARKLRRK